MTAGYGSAEALVVLKLELGNLQHEELNVGTVAEYPVLKNPHTIVQPGYRRQCRTVKSLSSSYGKTM